MRLHLTGGPRHVRDWGKIGKKKHEVKQVLWKLNPNIVFVTTGKADFVVIPTDAVELGPTAIKAEGEVITIDTLITGLKNQTLKIPVRKVSTHARKSTKNTSSKSFTKQSLSSKASLENTRAPKFKIRDGEVWKIFLFEKDSKDAMQWGLYGPSKKDIRKHFTQGAVSTNQPIKFVKNVSDANVLLVGDNASDDSRKAASRITRKFVLASALAEKLLEIKVSERIIKGYPKRVAQYESKE